MTWIADYVERRHRGFGVIRAEEERGRRYFAVRVDFPQTPGGWWPRTTETASLEDARAWIDEQRNEWNAFRDADDIKRWGEKDDIAYERNSPTPTVAATDNEGGEQR